MVDSKSPYGSFMEPDASPPNMTAPESDAVLHALDLSIEGGNATIISATYPDPSRMSCSELQAHYAQLLQTQAMARLTSQAYEALLAQVALTKQYLDKCSVGGAGKTSTLPPDSSPGVLVNVVPEPAETPAGSPPASKPPIPASGTPNPAVVYQMPVSTALGAASAPASALPKEAKGKDFPWWLIAVGVAAVIGYYSTKNQ